MKNKKQIILLIALLLIVFFLIFLGNIYSEPSERAKWYYFAFFLLVLGFAINLFMRKKKKIN